MRKIRLYVQYGGSYKQEEADADTVGVPYRAVLHDGDVCFLLKEGEIKAGPKRKRGIWQKYGGTKDFLFFTCPWCAGINQVAVALIDNGPKIDNSLWCTNKKCARHLFVAFTSK